MVDDPCEQVCNNTVGSYVCDCDLGFDLYTDNGTNSFFIPEPETGLMRYDVFHINHSCVGESYLQKFVVQ